MKNLELPIIFTLCVSVSYLLNTLTLDSGSVVLFGGVALSAIILGINYFRSK